jgi:hypothetical protein
MLEGIEHLLNSLGHLKGVSVGYRRNPLRLKLPDRPEGSISVYKELVLLVVTSERKELVKKLFILKQPISR